MAKDKPRKKEVSRETTAPSGAAKPTSKSVVGASAKSSDRAAEKPATKSSAELSKSSSGEVTKPGDGAKPAKSRSASREISVADVVAAEAAANAKGKTPAEESQTRSTPTPRPVSASVRKDLEPYRLLLVEKRRSLVGDMAGMLSSVMGDGSQDSGGELSKTPTDAADIGSEHYQLEFTVALVEKEQQTLSEIDEALRRIEEGIYLRCANTDCGKDIPRARLEAKPTAKYCIDCQRRAEKGLL